MIGEPEKRFVGPFFCVMARESSSRKNIGIRFAEFCLLNLAHCVPGQCIDDKNHFRQLEFGELIAQRGDDRVGFDADVG